MLKKNFIPSLCAVAVLSCSCKPVPQLQMTSIHIPVFPKDRNTDLVSNLS